MLIFMFLFTFDEVLSLKYSNNRIRPLLNTILNLLILDSNSYILQKVVYNLNSISAI